MNSWPPLPRPKVLDVQHRALLSAIRETSTGPGFPVVTKAKLNDYIMYHVVPGLYPGISRNEELCHEAIAVVTSKRKKHITEFCDFRRNDAILVILT